MLVSPVKDESLTVAAPCVRCTRPAHKSGVATTLTSPKKLFAATTCEGPEPGSAPNWPCIGGGSSGRGRGRPHPEPIRAIAESAPITIVWTFILTLICVLDIPVRRRGENFNPGPPQHSPLRTTATH